MEARGYGTFDEAAAVRWLEKLSDSEGGGLLEQTLLDPGKDDAPLDWGRGAELLAASEIVYGLLYGPRERVPERAAGWIRAHGHVDAACLKPVCERQLGRVLSEESELYRHWQQQDEAVYEAWRADVEVLRTGLTD